MSSKHILIAGHGYLGSRLATYWHQQSHQVTAITKSESTGLVRGGYPVCSCDISDEDAVAALGDDVKPDVVVHCASSNRGGAEAYEAVFLRGIENLTTIFPGVPLFLTSSTSVYGQTDGSEVTEDSLAEPERDTGRFLRKAEDLLLSRGGTVLRLAGIYGPSRSVHLKRMLEGTARIESGEVSRLLNQIHVADCVGALDFLMGLDSGLTGGEIFNVSDDCPITQRGCYEGLAKLLELPVPDEAEPDLKRKRAWTHKAVLNRKLRELGWELIYPSFFDAVSMDGELLPSIREQIGG